MQLKGLMAGWPRVWLAYGIQHFPGSLPQTPAGRPGRSTSAWSKWGWAASTGSMVSPASQARDSNLSGLKYLARSCIRPAWAASLDVLPLVGWPALPPWPLPADSGLTGGQEPEPLARSTPAHVTRFQKMSCSQTNPQCPHCLLKCSYCKG